MISKLHARQTSKKFLEALQRTSFLQGQRRILAVSEDLEVELEGEEGKEAAHHRTHLEASERRESETKEPHQLDPTKELEDLHPHLKAAGQSSHPGEVLFSIGVCDGQ